MKHAPSNSIAGTIDHTLLGMTATAADLARLCREALRFGFAAVCVHPCYVAEAAGHLAGSPVKVCSVVGFPLGASTREAKAFEAARAVADGAAEIDMVMNLCAFKSGRMEEVEEDIRAVVRAVEGRATVKVILETCCLSGEEIDAACAAARKAGAGYVKTSTGFGAGGATVEAVERMRRAVGGKMGIKASGGIGDLETARRMIAAGATRLGCSRSLDIVRAEQD